MERSNLMRRIRSVNTSAESVLRQVLLEGSLEFETNCADLPGKPDIVFREKRIAVFVDGEFWHGGQWRKRGLTALGEQFPDKGKRASWTLKIQKNCARDFLRTADLLVQGWTVARFWAGDVEKDPSGSAGLIQRMLDGSAPISSASYLPTRNAGEFFAGIGLARMGLMQAGWTVAFANDNSPGKVAFYKENAPNAMSYFDERDINDVDANDIPIVALATACFPCTDLSLAGTQRGLQAGTRSSAYLKFTQLLRAKGNRRPPFVLLENVLGMISSRDGVDFEICLEELQSAGYTVDAFVLDAKWFVPQSRPRLFVVAVRDDLLPLGHVSIEDATLANVLRPPRLMDFIVSHSSLPWSLRLLPRPKKSNRRLHHIIDQISDSDPRWWATKRAERLYSQMTPSHRDLVTEMMTSTSARYGTVFRRMRNGKSTAEVRTDGLAGCLRTPKGGSARQILLRASNGKYSVRLLTPRECARLMGADKIEIPQEASVNNALFAFGDGVCVAAVRWICDNYLNPLATELIRGRVLRLATA